MPSLGISKGKRTHRLYQSQAFPEKSLGSTRLNETSLIDPASYLNLSVSGSRESSPQPNIKSEPIKVEFANNERKY